MDAIIFYNGMEYLATDLIEREGQWDGQSYYDFEDNEHYVVKCTFFKPAIKDLIPIK